MAWSPGWKMSLFVALMLPGVVGLGIWQLNRADEKQVLLEAYHAQTGRLPVDSAVAADALFPDFTKVRLHGSYQSGQIFLLDNQVFEGTVGYTVMQQFNDRSGITWWVNRGFVAAPLSRDQLPAIPAVNAELRTIEGLIWPDLGLAPLLMADEWSDNWPKRIQRLNLARMNQALESAGETAAAKAFRLQAGQPGALEKVPMQTPGTGMMSAERHVGYAVQWFGLGAVLVIGLIIFGYRRT